MRHAHSNEGMSGSDKAQSPHPPKARKPIWELFEEASRKIPDEELDRLPTDLAAQVDHYIYGHSKQSS